MTWCNRCGYDYGLTSHTCGGTGNTSRPLTLTEARLMDGQYGTPQPESEKFFAKASILLDRIENGEVSFVPDNYWTNAPDTGAFQIVITPKEVE